MKPSPFPTESASTQSDEFDEPGIIAALETLCNSEHVVGLLQRGATYEERILGLDRTFSDTTSTPGSSSTPPLTEEEIRARHTEWMEASGRRSEDCIDPNKSPALLRFRNGNVVKASFVRMLFQSNRIGWWMISRV